MMDVDECDELYSEDEDLRQMDVALKCKMFLKKKILRPSCQGRPGFEEERSELISLMNKTVYNKTSSSALVVGHPGSGKSTLMRDVLEEMKSKKFFSSKALVVQLHGLLHTDDRLSLVAISRQMELENVVEDKVTGSFAENLLLLLDTLKSADKDKSKAVIFVLESFDLFCAHHNQTLLYNLFDIAHSNKASICVIGVTQRLDTLDLMEKRVKSRFSHRHVYVFPDTSKPGFAGRLKVCQSLLELDHTLGLEKKFVERWNKDMAILFKQGEPAHKALHRLFSVLSTETMSRQLLFLVVSRLNEEHQQIVGADFEVALDAMCKDHKGLILDGLSVLELCLVIAMKHLTEIYDGEPINFEMVLARYIRFAKQHSLMEDMGRPVVLKAFEHLQSVKVVVPVNAGGTVARLQREHQLHHFMVTSQQVTDAVRRHEELPTEVAQWERINLV